MFSPNWLQATSTSGGTWECIGCTTADPAAISLGFSLPARLFIPLYLQSPAESEVLDALGSIITTTLRNYGVRRSAACKPLCRGSLWAGKWEPWRGMLVQHACLGRSSAWPANASTRTAD